MTDNNWEWLDSVLDNVYEVGYDQSSFHAAGRGSNIRTSDNIFAAKRTIIEHVNRLCNQRVLAELKLHAPDWVEINEDGSINPAAVYDRIKELVAKP